MRRSTWARNWALRARTKAASKSVYLYMTRLLLAVGVVRRSAGAEDFAEVDRLGAFRPGLGVGEVGADDDVLLVLCLEEPQLRMRLVLDQLRLGVIAGPAVVGGEIDDIALDQRVGGDDFRGIGATHLSGSLGRRFLLPI